MLHGSADSATAKDPFRYCISRRLKRKMRSEPSVALVTLNAEWFAPGAEGADGHWVADALASLAATSEGKPYRFE